MLAEPVYDQLKSIQQPTLIIYGQQDMLIPNRYLHPQLTTDKIAKDANNSIANSQLKMINNAGHFVHFDQPTTINNMITDFISNN